MAKRFLLNVACGWLLCVSVPGFASNDQFATGRDWNQNMSENEKLIALVPPALLFEEFRVPLRLRLPEYIPIIDKVLLHNPKLGDEGVTNLFASAVYKFEPESRPALHRMEEEFLRGNYRLPRLRLDEDFNSAVT